ncbi:hypothetical protein FBULB1_5491 [Fusarium bulbicola]|nr:hypothetical protein FBULB1_5491 [Fusarium bulbicola]
MEHTASEQEDGSSLGHIPSPDEQNQEPWARTFLQAAKRDGIKADIKTTIWTDCPNPRHNATLGTFTRAGRLESIGI